MHYWELLLEQARKSEYEILFQCAGLFRLVGWEAGCTYSPCTTHAMIVIIRNGGTDIETQNARQLYSA